MIVALKNASQGTTGIDHVRKEEERGVVMIRASKSQAGAIRRILAHMGAAMMRYLKDKTGTETRGRMGVRRNSTDLRTKVRSIAQAGASLRIPAHSCAFPRIRAQSDASMSGLLNNEMVRVINSW